MGVGGFFWRLLRKHRREVMAVWRCRCRKRNDVKGYFGGKWVTG